MKLLIKSVKIIDPTSPHNGKVKDILIENGKIKSIKDKISADKNINVHNGKGQCVSPGWFDLRANFRDPGLEYKEDLNSGMKAAAAGGFTGVAVMPSTHPPIHSKAQVEYIKNKSAKGIVDVFPVAAVSNNLEGKDLTEMYDMFLSGAVAFSDDKNSVKDAGLLLRALLYAKNFNGLIMNYPNDATVSDKGKMNESITSALLGMKGMPAIAEEIIVARDLYLAEYTESRIHFSTISSAGSVELIRKAKAKGIKVTADVAAHQIALDDSSLSEFDSNYKVKPPLRTKKDISALKKGLADGTIDVICSDHSPEDEENKKTEFDYAAYGIIGLETAFAIANTQLEKMLKTGDIINKFAVRPREILNLPVPSVKEGNEANITIFDINKKWTFATENIRSKSKNTPFVGTNFKGRVAAVYNNGQFMIS